MRLKLGARLLSFALAGVLMIGGLTACDNGDKQGSGETTAPVTQEQQNPSTPQKPEEKGITEVILVKNSITSRVITQVCDGVRDYIQENTEIEVTIVNDFKYTYEAKEGRAYLYIGDPEDVDLSATAKEKAEKDSVVILTEDDKTAIYSDNETALWIAVDQFLENCVYDGKYKVAKMYNDSKADFSAYLRDGWKQPIPAYLDGELDSTLYSAGVGADLNDKDVSDMSLIRETNEDEFLQYVGGLEELGFKKLYANETDGNHYYGFTDALGIFIHAYYTKTEKIVRTVVDRNSTPLEDFCYTTEPSENSAFYMFNHNTEGENTFLIHCADNSWIFIDGGVSTLDDKYAQGLFKFMSEKSELKEGEKLVISAWYLTHAHRDHFQAFYALINQFHDRIDLQRMIANLPDHNVVSHNTNYKDFVPCMSLINRYYPDLMYMKAHTGMSIQIADVNFKILCAQEDLLDYWILNKEVWATVWSTWTQTGASSKPNYQFNRQADKKYDINNSSLVAYITVGNGLTALNLGDMYRANDWMFPKYSMETVTAKLLIFAHHMNNDELLNFYVDYVTQAGEIYGLCPSVEQPFTGGHANVKFSFKEIKKQYLIVAKYETIFEFTIKDGSVNMKTYDAYYSRTGKIDNL